MHVIGLAQTLRLHPFETVEKDSGAAPAHLSMGICRKKCHSKWDEAQDIHGLFTGMISDSYELGYIMLYQHQDLGLSLSHNFVPQQTGWPPGLQM